MTAASIGSELAAKGSSHAWEISEWEHGAPSRLTCLALDPVGLGN